MIHNHSSGKYRLWRKVLSVCIAFAMICSVSISAFAVEASSETANENIETVQGEIIWILTSQIMHIVD